MTSLTEVYEGVGTGARRRLYLGTALFLGGAFLVVIGIIAATTDLIAGLGLGTFGAREVAGVTAGLGVPAVFVGIFTVLPASRRERAAAAIGASVAIFGVLLFAQVYPDQWYGATADHLTLPVTVVYFSGTITTFWALFTAVVNFKTRNDPGGTVTLERTVAGETQKIEVPVSELQGGSLPEGTAIGSVGVVGGVDRDPVMESATNTGSTTDAEVLNNPSHEALGSPASDGGTSARTPTEPTRSEADAPNATDDTDRYCGTCSYFEYERTADGFEPYCGFHENRMDDMDPCDEWRPNTPR